MKPNELRTKYLEFYKGKEHSIVPSASLIPENDPTTLFTSSGMQPMVPYLLGEEHPEGKRVADSVRAVRRLKEELDGLHKTIMSVIGMSHAKGQQPKPHEHNEHHEHHENEGGEHGEHEKMHKY